MYTNRYANAPFENEYGITVNGILFNCDVANRHVCGNDDPKKVSGATPAQSFVRVTAE